jgi:predicted phage tail protein
MTPTDVDELLRHLENAVSAVRAFKVAYPEMQRQMAEAEKRRDAAKAEHDNVLMGTEALYQKLRRPT